MTLDFDFDDADYEAEEEGTLYEDSDWDDNEENDPQDNEGTLFSTRFDIPNDDFSSAGFDPSDTLEKIDHNEGHSEQKSSAIQHPQPQNTDEFDTPSPSDSGDILSIVDQVTISRESFSISEGLVNVNHLATLLPLREYRSETHAGLMTSIKEMGILTPIVVTPTESYLDFLSENNITSSAEADALGYTGLRYRVLDGFRRLYACTKLGIEDLPARIITYKDPDLAAETGVIMSLILNRYQRHSMLESWGMMQTLELLATFTPASLEWLLALDPGDSLRLKDVMLCEYPEIIEQFTEGKKTLLQAYNALQKTRKEENQTARDDQRSLRDVDGAEELIEEGTQQILSDEDVRQLLEMGSTDISDLDDDNFGEGDNTSDMFGGASDDYVQDTKDRERISPELRSQILRRDGFMCQVCGFGEGVTSSIQLGMLETHHITAVYTGGTDSPNNFVTTCSRCHAFIHILAGFNGKIGMSKEEFENVPDEQQRTIKNAVKYARVLLEAEAKAGKKLKKYKPVRIPFWTAQAEGQQVLAALSHNAPDSSEGDR